MPRRPLYQRDAPEGTPFQPRPMRGGVLSGISPSFEKLSRTGRQVVYVLLTRAPLYSPPEGSFLVRLACVKHAASVRSEPGSNSCVQSNCAIGPHAPRPKPRGAKAQPKLNTRIRQDPNSSWRWTRITTWTCRFPCQRSNGPEGPVPLRGHLPFYLHTPQPSREKFQGLRQFTPCPCPAVICDARNRPSAKNSAYCLLGKGPAG